MYQYFSSFPHTRSSPLAMLNIPLPADHNAVTAVRETIVAGDFKERSFTMRNARDL